MYPQMQPLYPQMQPMYQLQPMAQQMQPTFQYLPQQSPPQQSPPLPGNPNPFNPLTLDLGLEESTHTRKRARAEPRLGKITNHPARRRGGGTQSIPFPEAAMAALPIAPPFAVAPTYLEAHDMLSAVPPPQPGETAPSPAAQASPAAPGPAAPAAPGPAEPSPAPGPIPGAAPGPSPGKPPSEAEDPFALHPRREQQLRLFLQGHKGSWNPAPAKFRPRQPEEDTRTYVNDLRLHYNGMGPKIFSALNLFLPPVMKRNYFQEHGAHVALSSMTQPHLQVLNKLYSLHHARLWRGIMALYPWCTLEWTKYNFLFSEGVDPSASLLEAHRRVLENERVCRDLTHYLADSISRTESLCVFSKNHLKQAFAAISAGSGIFGSGAGFWTKAPADLPAITVLLQSLAAHELTSLSTEDTTWLAAHRLAAFTRHYTVATELDWGVQLVALACRVREHLEHLDEMTKAEFILTTFEGEIRERTTLYIKDMLPLLVYGGRLTRYVRDLHRLCTDHFSVLSNIPGCKGRIPMPLNCKLLQLDPGGKLIGPDGQPSLLGHFNIHVAEGEPRPALPFPEECCALQPDQALPLLARHRLEKEESRIAELVGAHFDGDESQALTITRMRQGYKNALEWMANDSHEARATACLPPTASMPEALYCPERVFAA